MFKFFRINKKDRLNFGVSRDLRTNKEEEKEDTLSFLTCKHCGFVAKSKAGLKAHLRKHK